MRSESQDDGRVRLPRLLSQLLCEVYWARVRNDWYLLDCVCNLCSEGFLVNTRQSFHFRADDVSARRTPFLHKTNKPEECVAILPCYCVEWVHSDLFQ